MRIMTYILWIVLIILGVSFALLNSQHVPLDYFVGKTTIYFPFLVIILFFLGALLAVLALLPLFIRSSAKIRRLKSKLKAVDRI